MAVRSEVLEQAAVFYLARYAASRQRVRRYLVGQFRKQQRKNAQKRAGEASDESIDPDEMIRSILDRLEGLGYLDDQRFAEDRYHVLHERGLSRIFMQQKLLADGLSYDLVDRLLSTHKEEHELAAARNYAKRRQFGIYRQNVISEESEDEADAKEEDLKQRQRELQSLVRRGFSMDIARAALSTVPDMPEAEYKETDSKE